MRQSTLAEARPAARAQTSMRSPARVGAVPALETLSLYRNQVGDASVSALAAALGEGAAPRLAELDLLGNRFSADSARLD